MTEAEIKNSTKDVLWARYKIAIIQRYANIDKSREKEIILMEREILSRMIK